MEKPNVMMALNAKHTPANTPRARVQNKEEMEQMIVSNFEEKGLREQPNYKEIGRPQSQRAYVVQLQERIG